MKIANFIFQLKIKIHYILVVIQNIFIFILNIFFNYRDIKKNINSSEKYIKFLNNSNTFKQDEIKYYSDTVKKTLNNKKSFTNYNNFIKHLLSLKERFQPNTIIEIGTGHGETTILFRHLFPKTLIYTIEPPVNYKSSNYKNKHENEMKIYYDDLNYIFKNNNINFLRTISKELLNDKTFLNNIKGPNIMILIDGCHDYPDIQFDINLILELINKFEKKENTNFHLIFDDYKIPSFSKLASKVTYLPYSWSHIEDGVFKAVKYLKENKKISNEKIFFRNNKLNINSYANFLVCDYFTNNEIK